MTDFSKPFLNEKDVKEFYIFKYQMRLLQSSGKSEEK
jgi:hypothetical protein